MTKRSLRLVAELTVQEEAEITALEATIHNIHQLADLSPENRKNASKSIRSIRKEAERSLEALRTVDVGELDAHHQREYLVHFETFNRIIAATNRVQPSRPM